MSQLSAAVQTTLDTLSSASPLINAENTARWLSGLTADQLATVGAAFDGFEEKPDYERLLLDYMLFPMRNNNQSALAMFDVLALHKAFIVPKVIKGHQYSFTLIHQIALGLRNTVKVPLDLSTEQKRKEFTALAHFAFEISGRGLPCFTNVYTRGLRVETLRYKDPALKQTVILYADRMDQLIHYALTRSTDPKMLEILMDADNVTALNDGLL